MSVAILLSARRRPRPRLALLLLTLLLIAASLVHLGLGARWIAPQTVLQALLEYDPRNFEQRIIIDLRLVRLAAALLTGAALGVAGLLLQTVIRNPLGEPHILGLNAGASLAVVATSALGLSFGAFPAGRPLTAACGAGPVSYTHLRAHKTEADLVCRLLLEKKKSDGGSPGWPRGSRTADKP